MVFVVKVTRAVIAMPRKPTTQTHLEEKLAWLNENPKKVHSGIHPFCNAGSRLSLAWCDGKEADKALGNGVGRGIGSTAHILTTPGTDTCRTGGTEDRTAAGMKR